MHLNFGARRRIQNEEKQEFSPIGFKIPFEKGFISIPYKHTYKQFI